METIDTAESYKAPVYVVLATRTTTENRTSLKNVTNEDTKPDRSGNSSKDLEKIILNCSADPPHTIIIDRVNKTAEWGIMQLDKRNSIPPTKQIATLSKMHFGAPICIILPGIVADDRQHHTWCHLVKRTSSSPYPIVPHTKKEQR